MLNGGILPIAPSFSEIISKYMSQKGRECNNHVGVRVSEQTREIWWAGLSHMNLVARNFKLLGLGFQSSENCIRQIGNFQASTMKEERNKTVQDIRRGLVMMLVTESNPRVRKV